MSKGDKEGFIVKFVESKTHQTEYAVKAYEVNSILKSFIDNCIVSTVLLSLCLP